MIGVTGSKYLEYISRIRVTKIIEQQWRMNNENGTDKNLTE
jgi:hypothetical protein